MTRALLAAALVALAVPAWAGEIAGPAVPIDGDTIRIEGERIRLFGIDAPEKAQTCEAPSRYVLPWLHVGGGTYQCGRDAAAVLSEMVRGRIVTCEPRDTDRYGRTVAICAVDGKDIGEDLVRRGWAVDYRHYDKECRYCAAEAEAKAAGRGIWSGRFTMPAEFRKEHRR